MPKRFEYSRYIRKLATRLPVLNYLILQISLWVIAYLFLSVLTDLVLLTAGPMLHATINFRAGLFIALFFGFFNGLAAGYASWIFEKRFYNKALWLIILGKAIISFIVFVLLISIVRSVIFPYLQERYFDAATPPVLQQSWDAFFYLLLLYNIFIGLLISFINQVNKKYGPGVLFPLLLGKYRKPKEEERIILFMDLKSSTTIAETMENLRYSAFIRDSFMDINAVLSTFNAQIYQYIGDEIVISWTIEEGLKGLSCIKFFFACQEKFKARSGHYIDQYGQVPEFKAGLHMGKIVVVEIGYIKRDIAYHGDTMNTAARIQSVCNDYNKNFLASVHVLANTGIAKYYKTESIGLVELKGKNNPIEITSISRLAGI
ncbi:MAG: adenylate/guanylate cyclase domain-containing protein [Ferruginibacter sp.]